jgi:hypothetical protein
MRFNLENRTVNYSMRVVYGPGVGPTPILPDFTNEARPHVSGVYMLTEAGRFYIGQSADVAGRILGHLSNPACCGFTEPRCLLLASVPPWFVPWKQNAHRRLVAEARFIAAALSMNLPLTNTLSDYKRRKLLSLFPELAAEREIVERGVHHAG